MVDPLDGLAIRDVTAARIPSTSWAKPATQSELFAGFTMAEMAHAARCLQITERRFQRGEPLLDAGGVAGSVGLVLEGAALEYLTRPDGTRHLAAVLEAGDVYGEQQLWPESSDSAANGAPGGTRPQCPDTRRAGDGPARTVHAATELWALRLATAPILDAHLARCGLRGRVVENLFRIFAAKNRRLQSHLEVVAQRSLRARVMAYLAQQRRLRESDWFTLPLSRADLAEHLGVDRAALSRELSRMKDEGLIDYQRATFHLLQGERNW